MPISSFTMHYNDFISSHSKTPILNKGYANWHPLFGAQKVIQHKKIIFHVVEIYRKKVKIPGLAQLASMGLFFCGFRSKNNNIFQGTSPEIQKKLILKDFVDL